MSKALFFVVAQAMLQYLYKPETTGMIVFKKQHGDFYLGDYVAPKARFLKYPMVLEHLISRIINIAWAYDIPVSLKSYRMNTEGIQQAKLELKGKGGIYLWYCHSTGYFYVGSGRVFFGKDARLSTYLAKSRLSGKYRHVSPDLAQAMLEFGYDSFTLIILEEYDIGMNLDMLVRQEQLWIMLYPTYNRSLKVGSNEGQPMLEEDRRAMSTIVYQYEVIDGHIVVGSEQQHYGIKNLTRTGFTSVAQPDVTIPISYFDLNVLLKTGATYKDRFLFTTEQMVGKTLANWGALVGRELTKGTDKRSFGVYVYKYPAGMGISTNTSYTSEDFVEFIPSVAECRRKYSISKTHFQRIRKYVSPHKGLVFSDFQLHNK